ncbi:hypothetical protein [Blastopirellula marina]|uniref:Uncharacterized protein n=1 Tax=Blastopirellula marina DSM 3645 TaxID=314230 RepID=A3ZUZ6_9BACT|nr:hypothetical protein [Blastopirellula marina]EAQ79732.1 hypothetical protein DSM3645_24525 [Blastopirellula marina DSM 3645]
MREVSKAESAESSNPMKQLDELFDSLTRNLRSSQFLVRQGGFGRENFSELYASILVECAGRMGRLRFLYYEACSEYLYPSHVEIFGARPIHLFGSCDAGDYHEFAFEYCQHALEGIIGSLNDRLLPYLAICEPITIAQVMSGDFESLAGWSSKQYEIPVLDEHFATADLFRIEKYMQREYNLALKLAADRLEKQRSLSDRYKEPQEPTGAKSDSSDAASVVITTKEAKDLTGAIDYRTLKKRIESLGGKKLEGQNQWQVPSSDWRAFQLKKVL